MNHPLVIAYHLVRTGYGWWLPNDPRGSMSKAIKSDIISELGQLHYGRKRMQPAGKEIREFYEDARGILRHPLLRFDMNARRIIADAFSEVIAVEKYTCHACAVMPDHVHLLIRKHRDSSEEMIAKLKENSAAKLMEADFAPLDHPIWPAGPGWNVFLDHPRDIRRTIGYIEKNPLPLGEDVQRWCFVVPYDNWPFHPGHSPNSPYAKALRALGQYPIVED